MTDELAIPKLQRPQYESYQADVTALNGAIVPDTSSRMGQGNAVFVKPIEDVAEAAQENADELGEFISKVCREAVEKTIAESLNAINAKIQTFQTESLSYVNRIETVAKLKDEAESMKVRLSEKAVGLAERETRLGISIANQTVSLRTLLAGSLITSSLVWIYCIYDPQPARIAAAGACSLLMLGPLVALYWRKG